MYDSTQSSVSNEIISFPVCSQKKKKKILKVAQHTSENTHLWHLLLEYHSKRKDIKKQTKQKTLFYEHAFIHIIHRNYFVHITLHICKKKIAFMRLKLAIVCEDQPVSPFTLFMIDQMCESPQNIRIKYCLHSLLLW